jgi:ElaB/YqjD/DUF883 family membrane-anchored ribosome-binding protein
MSEATSFGQQRGTSSSSSDFNRQATQQADRAIDAVKDTAQRLSDQGRDIQGNVQAVADNLGSAIEKSLKEQPYTTLALAAGMGFVLGAIWKS